MEYLRYMIKVNLPLADDPTGMKTKEERVQEALPELLNTVVIQGLTWTRFKLIQKVLKYLRSLSVTVNEGTLGEEKSVSVMQICRHAEGLLCSDKEELGGEAL